jgi:hypothetical protein
MQTETNTFKPRKYFTITGGKLRQKVEEGTPGAEIREYVDKEGNKKSVTELVFKSILGKITNVKIEDTQIGRFVSVEIDGEGSIQMNIESSFASDFMSKLKNLDLKEDVKFGPYDFESEGKRIKGLTIMQVSPVTKDWAKVPSYYYDVETKKVKNGMPEAPTDRPDKDDWKIYFTTVRKFLTKEMLTIFPEEKQASLEDFN